MKDNGRKILLLLESAKVDLTEAANVAMREDFPEIAEDVGSARSRVESVIDDIERLRDNR